MSRRDCLCSQLSTFLSAVCGKVWRGQREVVGGGGYGQARDKAEDEGDSEGEGRKQGEAAMGHAQRASLCLGSALENGSSARGDGTRPV